MSTILLKPFGSLRVGGSKLYLFRHHQVQILLPLAVSHTQVRGIFNLPPGFNASRLRSLLPSFVRASGNEKGNSDSSNSEKEGERANVAPSGPFQPSPRDLFFLAVLALVLYYFYVSNNVTNDQLDWITFKQYYLPGGASVIKEVRIVGGGTVLITFQPNVTHFQTGQPLRRSGFRIADASIFQEQLVAAQNDLGFELWERVPLTCEQPSSYFREFMSEVPFLMMLGLSFLLFNSFRARSGALGGGRGNPFNMTSSRAKLINANKATVTFKDVAGLDEAKVEIMEFVHFLKQPEKYTQLGAKIPRPGKTLLAKATAGEAGVPFFSVSGSDFMEMYVGVGPARVRDLFAKARQKAPCIIFIDEIDAIGRKRGRRNVSNDEGENTLNQLLVEMDGFNTQGGVIVLAGTNRPDVLDNALTRPGRFDRTITIDPPDLKGRKDILKVHLAPLKLEDATPIDQYAEHIATLTPGMSGADLQNICNEAALIAARHEKKFVQMDDLEAAIERVIGGLEKKDKVLSLREKRIVAYHEAGHAVSGWYLEFANPLLKVSIIPRGSAALGYAQYQPHDKHLYRKHDLFDRMCMMLGGRISEEISFGSISTGARDDLEKVTAIAYELVTTLGMSDVIGQLSFKAPQSEFGMEDRPYSQATADKIDFEARKLIREAEERTRELLTQHRDDLIKVAEKLLEKEKLNKDDMIELLGDRPWKELRTFQELSH